MKTFSSTFTAFFALTALSGTVLAQTAHMESEPNSEWTESNIIAMAPGDTINGSTFGFVEGVGNGAADTVDYWEVTTPAQAMPGMYRWELAVPSGFTIETRGAHAVPAMGGGTMIDPTGINDQAGFSWAGTLAWYSNEDGCTVHLRVGQSTSGGVPSYLATLSVTMVTPTQIPGSINAGSIRFTGEGVAESHDGICILDENRNLISTMHQHYSPTAVTPNQMDMTRTLTAGTYYVGRLARNGKVAEGAPADDGYPFGEIMLPGCYVVGDNGSFLQTADLDFEIIDSAGATSVVAQKTMRHEIVWFELTVVADYPTSCNGDGGNQMGCTDCPCGNNAMPGTIGGCLNSALTSARLQASGDPSVSLPSGSTTDLRLAISGVPPNAFCILNSGDGVAPGNMANPCFGMNSGAQAAAFDGLRCAIQNTRRHGGRSADGNGDVGAANSPWGGEGGPPVGLAVAFGGFAAGSTRYFQVINRDDPLLVCMRGLNTSQAVEVTFTP